MHAMRKFHRMHSRNKVTRQKMPLLKSISMAVQHTRDIFSATDSSIVVRCHHVETISVHKHALISVCVVYNMHSFLMLLCLFLVCLCGCQQPLLEVEIVKDHHVGLGMSMIASTHGPNDDQDRLVVNALRSRPDGSKGPAQEVGVKIGDLLVTANGYAITDFASLKRAVGNSKFVTIELERKASIEKLPEPVNYDGHYPEIVLLNVIRDSPATKLGAKLAEMHEHGHSSYYDDDEDSHMVVKHISAGPLLHAGLNLDDVILTIDDYNVATLKQLSSLVQNKTDMEFVVKRMSRSQGGKGRRENNTYTFNITISDEMGLGLNLKEIKSGLGERSSNTFLYVKDLREYPNGDPGPGLIAGVRPYDLLLKIKGTEIHTITDAKRAMEGEETVECEVRRLIHQFSAYDPNDQDDSNEETVVVTRAAGESLGLALSEAYGAKSANPFLLVTKVRSGSAGERSGIQVHDIIRQVQHKEVSHLHDLQKGIDGLEEFELTVRRRAKKNSKN